MRARFFTFQRDMRFPIGLSDGNTVIFKGKVCRNIDCRRIAIAVKQRGFDCMNTQNRALKGNFSNTTVVSIACALTKLSICRVGTEGDR